MESGGRRSASAIEVAVVAVLVVAVGCRGWSRGFSSRPWWLWRARERAAGSKKRGLDLGVVDGVVGKRKNRRGATPGLAASAAVAGDRSPRTFDSLPDDGEEEEIEKHAALANEKKSALQPVEVVDLDDLNGVDVDVKVGIDAVATADLLDAKKLAALSATSPPPRRRTSFEASSIEQREFEIALSPLSEKEKTRAAAERHLALQTC